MILLFIVLFVVGFLLGILFRTLINDFSLQKEDNEKTKSDRIRLIMKELEESKEAHLTEMLTRLHKEEQRG